MANSFTLICSTTVEVCFFGFGRLGEEGEETFYRTYAEVCDRFDAMELSSDSKGTLCLRYVRHYPFDNTFYKQTHYVLLYCYKVCIFLLWSII
ncbi:hypothetical protein Bca101_015398 [Brassica carinata]